jgi:alanine or glycine:cation symporter, AGCS family
MKSLGFPRPPAFFIFLTAIFSLIAAPAAQPQETSRWETDIAAFGEADRTSPPETGGIVFMGSSSILRWGTLQEDFPDFHVVNRGFGGSQLTDCVAFADRILLPHQPRLVMLYAGENDIAAGRTPEQVAAEFARFAEKVTALLPDVQIGFISLKPSPRRSGLTAQFREANALIQAQAQESPHLFFVDVFNPMLDGDGQPRTELFAEDRLHLNTEGYRLWQQILQPELEERLSVEAPWHERLNDRINSIVWGPPFMILLAGTGLYLTFRLGFFQFRHLGLAWRESFGRFFHKSREVETGALSSFQAVSSAMAATVGVGNIAGVSTAIALGGPGALFWMWMIALVGMATKFAEASLGVKYRHIAPDGEVSGGVMYYIEKGLGPNWRWLAVAYALLAGVAALGIGNMVQANTVASALEGTFSIPKPLTGIVIIALVGVVTLGGVKRIGRVAERIVPLMVVLYLLAAILVLLLNLAMIPEAFRQIFYHAFNPAPAAGGLAGITIATAIRMGVARGIFSNEAGLGSASIVHAQATNDPVRQGMWGMWEVFIDTIVVATMTGLVILVMGVRAEATRETAGSLAANAFSAALPGIGGILVILALVLFAYTTMLTWNFYGEKSWEYLFGHKIILPYRLAFLGFLYIGAIGGLTFVWSVADTLNGLMAIPNLIALILLAGILVKAKNNYMATLRSSENDSTPLKGSRE